MLRLVATNSDVSTCIMGLWELENQTNVDFSKYKEDKETDFQNALDNGYDLLPTGVFIPELPETTDLTPE